MHLNLTSGMLPGLFVLAAGAVMTVFADRLTRKKENVNQVRLLGTALAFTGAILVFLV